MVNNMAAKLMKLSIMFKPKFLNEFGKRLNSSSSCLNQELESAFNDQINLEFFASFSYLAMATFFGKQNVAFPGCCKYFSNQVLDEREHAHKLIDYLLRRGNTVVFHPIEAPHAQCWESPLAAFQDALKLEKNVTQKLHLLRKTSEDCGDLCACILLDNEFLENQIEESDRLSRYVAQLQNIGSDGTGIFLFDRTLLKESK